MAKKTLKEAFHEFAQGERPYLYPPFVLNAEAVADPPKAEEGAMEYLTTNLASSRHPIRHEKLHGRDYLVVPMVMLTEGVHRGNRGPLYYPGEELGKVPGVWDHKPIVVYHPKNAEGKGISACIPEVLNRTGVGMVLNTRFDTKTRKLRAEAWLDEAKLDSVDKRIRQTIESRRVMEVSTGLFSENVPESGTFNGKPYEAIATNYRPDHLALLPDEKGACSVADGAGLYQLNSSTEYLSDSLADLEAIFDTAGLSLNDEARQGVLRVLETVSNAALEKKGAQSMPKKEIIDRLIANKATKLEEKDRPTLEALSETALEGIEAATKPKPADPPSPNPGSSPTNPAPNPSPTTGQNPQPTQNPPPANPPAQPTPQGATVNNAAPTGSAPSRPVTAEEYINNAPPEVREMLADGLASREAERRNLISAITANEANIFTEDYLKTQTTNQLKGIAALAKKPEPTAQSASTVPMFNFAGQGVPERIDNAGDFEALEPTTIEWARK